VYVALRRLATLVAPPEDAMKPAREEFVAVLGRCRAALAERRAKAEELVAQAKRDAKSQLDAKLVTGARDSLAKAERMGVLLDRLERDGLAAHAKRDKYVWARLYDTLTDVEAELRERPNVGELPRVLAKLLAGQQVIQCVQELDRRAGELADGGKLRDWREEIETIRRSLMAALAAVKRIDDDLPSDQGMAQIRQLFARTVMPLQQSIRQLGTDVRAG
jgi:predicted RNase H-like nuclease (RuvC/YqgF family)